MYSEFSYFSSANWCSQLSKQPDNTDEVLKAKTLLETYVKYIC